MPPRRGPAREPGPPTLDEVTPLLKPYLGRRAVLAVSGGPDSVALMRFAVGLARRGDAEPPTVAVVDHRLREGSTDEARAVARWAEACGLSHRILSRPGAKPATGLQDAARQARYRLLVGFAGEIGAAHVLTAHHLDDQAETVLMRFARGSGPAGLGGMRPETLLGGVTIARPFLGLRKARLVAACEAEGWPFFEDPSNSDPGFARTRVRALLASLASEGLTAERLARLGFRAQRWEEAVQRSAERAFERLVTREGERLLIDGAALLGEPDEIVGRVLSRSLGAVARERRPQRLERLETLAAALADAVLAGRRHKANLGGALVEVGPDRRIVVVPEPPRRRSPRASDRPDAAGVPHSLGTRDGRA